MLLRVAVVGACLLCVGLLSWAAIGPATVPVLVVLVFVGAVASRFRARCEVIDHSGQHRAQELRTRRAR